MKNEPHWKWKLCQDHQQWGKVCHHNLRTSQSVSPLSPLRFLQTWLEQRGDEAVYHYAIIMGISNKIKEEEEEEEERKAYCEEQEDKVCTIQELLFSSFSVDLLVGEEALIESTQALILPPPQPVSITLRDDGFVQMMAEAAPGASGLGTTACWKMAESRKETTTSMLKPVI